jgi:hypothetical protein
VKIRALLHTLQAQADDIAYSSVRADGSIFTTIFPAGVLVHIDFHIE